MYICTHVYMDMHVHVFVHSLHYIDIRYLVAGFCLDFGVEYCSLQLKGGLSQESLNIEGNSFRDLTFACGRLGCLQRFTRLVVDGIRRGIPGNSLHPLVPSG